MSPDNIQTAYCAAGPFALIIQANDTHIHSVSFTDKLPASSLASHPLLVEAVAQFKAYCSGHLHVFDLPLQMQGTSFQLRVWEELTKIPYGQTISYATLADRLGDPACIRAAAAANGKNKLAILIPCHRVIGSNGKLVGYAGGLDRKRWLLQHEAAYSRIDGSLFDNI